ncbi:MAG: LytTR family DNA-binding domain-containing protein [Bacteroidota bacterium]
MAEGRGGPYGIYIRCTVWDLEMQLKAFPPIQRIHKSYLVNKNFIVEIDNQLVVLSNKQELPIGSSYKDDFFKDMRIF